VTEARLSVPPNPKEFSKADLEDWYVGTGLIDTCVETYNTKTCVWRIPSLAAEGR
jgi:hypothetical protein